MALNNKDKIDRGMEAVMAGLKPYVLRESKSHHKNRWRYAVAGELVAFVRNIHVHDGLAAGPSESNITFVHITRPRPRSV